MVGGGTPRDGEVVLSLTRLQGLEPVDLAAAQVTAGAGVTLERLQAHARAVGLEFPVDHGARSSATLGGMVATNAGGPLAVRYGTTGAQVAGVEVALPSGEVVTRLAGLLKDNAGLDLPKLLVGSEGILGVITRVRLRLVPHRAQRTTALFGLGSTEQALAVLERLRRAAPSLEAADYFQQTGLRHVCARLGIAGPFPQEYPVYLIVDCAADRDPTDELEAVADLVEASALARGEAERRALWLYREAHNETLRALGIPLKLDVSVPVAATAVFEERLRPLLADLVPDSELILFGHLGDGNAHVNILGTEPRTEAVEEAVLALAAGLGGSISAEHGVGVAKARWLRLCRSDAEIALMKRVKRAFDPDWMLNPGRVLVEPDPGPGSNRP
jgi:FAD/FMN-containing dehydrogenase